MWMDHKQWREPCEEEGMCPTSHKEGRDIYIPGEGDLTGNLPEIAGTSRVKQLHNTATSSHQYLYRSHIFTIY